MFCAKCGNQMEDGLSFCPKCGNQMGRAVNRDRRSNKIGFFDGYIANWRECFAPNRTFRQKAGWMGGHIAVLAVILLIVLVVKPDGGKPAAAAGADSYAEEAGEIGKDISELTINADTVLDGNYSNLRTITSENGAGVTLAGEFPALSAVFMNSDANGAIGDFVFESGTIFPALTEFHGSTIMNSDRSNGFDTDAFPALSTVHINIMNREFDEAFAYSYVCIRQMQSDGIIRDFQVEVGHDISDLYGTWVNSDNTFSLTFESDGRLRVADSGNLLGADLFKYSEQDDDTLSLQADTGNAFVDVLSLSLDYFIFGDELTVSFAGNELNLTRK